MATRPFFSGNYGGPIGSTAQAAQFIANAGVMHAKALTDLGQAGAAAIEKLRLNKEEKEKEKSRYQLALEFGSQMGVSSDPFEVSAWAKAVAKDKDNFQVALQGMQAKNQLEHNRFMQQQQEAQTANAAAQLKLSKKENKRDQREFRQKQRTGRQTREAENLYNNYLMGTVTGAYPALGEIEDPEAFAKQAASISQIEKNPILDGLLARRIDSLRARQDKISAEAEDRRVKQSQIDAATTAATRTAEQKIRERSLEGSMFGEKPVTGMAPDATTAKDLRESLVNYDSMQRDLDALIELGKYREDNLYMDGDKKTEAARLAERIHGLLREDILGPGVVTEQEREILKRQIPDPTAGFDFAVNTFGEEGVALLQEAKEFLEEKMKARLIANGLTIGGGGLGGGPSTTTSTGATVTVTDNALGVSAK